MKCKCDMRTRMVGDGCEVCNPTFALELVRERIAELESRMREMEQAYSEGVDYGYFKATHDRQA